MSLRNQSLQALVDASQERKLAVLERLCAKLSIGDACWAWHAATDRDGYGVFQLQRCHAQRAIRVMYALAHGRVPNVVRHTCDQPSCVNPAHLVDGTNKQNTQDMMARGRHHNTSGARNGSAKLTQEDVQQIRTRYAAGGVTHKQLAKEFAVDRSQICHIVLGTRWTSCH